VAATALITQLQISKAPVLILTNNKINLIVQSRPPPIPLPQFKTAISSYLNTSLGNTKKTGCQEPLIKVAGIF